MMGLMKNGDFKFFIDGMLMVDDVDPHDSTWKVYRFELEGDQFHEFTWIYKKFNIIGDPELNASISHLKIVGILAADTECTVCPEGFYAEEGSSSCSFCPANTYYDIFSVEEPTTYPNICKDCSSGEYSFPGALTDGQCMLQPDCTKDDVIATYGDCINNLRSIDYEWRSPRFCEATSAYPLPSDVQNDPCNTCPKGYYF